MLQKWVLFDAMGVIFKVGEWSRYLRRLHGLDRIMDACIISGDVGFRKPSQEIYRRALQQIDADAADCVFVDDRDKNLVPARDLGM